MDTDRHPLTGRQADEAVRAMGLRSEVESTMSAQTYDDESPRTRSVTRFLAAPTDVNWGGKVHGGNVMHWIDEAATLCGTRWTATECVSVYAGGVRFYRPMQIGDLVELEARLLHTGEHTMHISIHVSSGDPRTSEKQLTTHRLAGRHPARQRWPSYRGSPLDPGNRRGSPPRQACRRARQHPRPARRLIALRTRQRSSRVSSELQEW
jgi:acyl-CoA hydrolase